jgi:hypothetical protein
MMGNEYPQKVNEGEDVVRNSVRKMDRPTDKRGGTHPGSLPSNTMTSRLTNFDIVQHALRVHLLVEKPRTDVDREQYDLWLYKFVGLIVSSIVSACQCVVR